MSNRRLHEARKARAREMWQKGASTIQIAAEIHVTAATVQGYVQPIRGVEKRRIPTDKTSERAVALRGKKAKVLRMHRQKWNCAQIGSYLGIPDNTVWRWIDESKVKIGIKAKAKARTPKQRKKLRNSSTSNIHICVNSSLSNRNQPVQGFDHKIDRQHGRTWGWA